MNFEDRVLAKLDSIDRRLRDVENHVHAVDTVVKILGGMAALIISGAGVMAAIL